MPGAGLLEPLMIPRDSNSTPLGPRGLFPPRRARAPHLLLACALLACARGGTAGKSAKIEIVQQSASELASADTLILVWRAPVSGDYTVAVSKAAAADDTVVARGSEQAGVLTTTLIPAATLPSGSVQITVTLVPASGPSLVATIRVENQDEGAGGPLDHDGGPEAGDPDVPYPGTMHDGGARPDAGGTPDAGRPDAGGVPDAGGTPDAGADAGKDAGGDAGTDAAPDAAPPSMAPCQSPAHPCPAVDEVSVPAGIYTVGSPETQGRGDEHPDHPVQIAAFAIDRTEVTNANYSACVTAGACTPPAQASSQTRPSYYRNATYARFPVVYVSYAQAAAYCAWVHERLPTEAEWEKAARGVTDLRQYPWSSATPTCAQADVHLSGCGADTVAVGSLAAGLSPFGAVEMCGNVAEWVADWYSATYYAQSPSSNPQGPATGMLRVVRGGSFSDDAASARVAFRGSLDPTTQSASLGFRCGH
jgi:formylglycine-generating enzyme required for sulfatase activity